MATLMTPIQTSSASIPAPGAQSRVATHPDFSDPSGIAFTRTGQILVGDSNGGPGNDGAIFRVDPRTGAVAVLAGGDPILQSVHLELSANGFLYVPDHQAD